MSDKLNYRSVQEYLLDLVPPREPELREMETYAERNDFPIIGPVAGALCYQIARMIGAKSVFEMGSGYGYSTAWFARAVQENGGGEVHHVVWDKDLSSRARLHLERLGVGRLIRYHIAEAVETLRQQPGPFDLIFNDIDKAGYPASLPVIADRLRAGGVLIVDNALWHGRIFDGDDDTEATAAVRELTRMLRDDEAWLTSLVPIRDGLLVAVRDPASPTGTGRTT